MKWQIQKILDIGTSNPIVARLLVQPKQILESFTLSLTEEQKKEIKNILGAKVALRLINCYKKYIEIEEEIDKINDMGFKKQLSSNSINVPSIIGLQYSCESFLYEAKLALRDLTELFNVLYNKSFNGARYDKVANWACDKFGENDDLFKIINENQMSWIKKIIDMRNAVEHPSSNLGELVIHNVKLINTHKPPFLEEPKWYLEGNIESSILSDMKTIVGNILSFSEDILVVLLSKLPNHLPYNAPIKFKEIPEEERNPSCPIRIEAFISAKDLGLPIE